MFDSVHLLLHCLVLIDISLPWMNVITPHIECHLVHKWLCKEKKLPNNWHHNQRRLKKSKKMFQIFSPSVVMFSPISVEQSSKVVLRTLKIKVANKHFEKHILKNGLAYLVFQTLCTIFPEK